MLAWTAPRTVRWARRNLITGARRVEGLGRFSQFSGRVLGHAVVDVVFRLRFRKTVLRHISDTVVGAGADDGVADVTEHRLAEPESEDHVDDGMSEYAAGELTEPAEPFHPTRSGDEVPPRPSHRARCRPRQHQNTRCGTRITYMDVIT